MPVVQANVTVDEGSSEPGAGEIIWARAEAPGVLVTVGVSVFVGVAVEVRVAVAVGVFDGVSDGPAVGEAVAVRVGVGDPGGTAGVEVTTPGP